MKTNEKKYVEPLWYLLLSIAILSAWLVLRWGGEPHAAAPYVLGVIVLLVSYDTWRMPRELITEPLMYIAAGALSLTLYGAIAHNAVVAETSAATYWLALMVNSVLSHFKGRKQNDTI